MNIQNAKYEVTAVKPEQYPSHQLPEIALVGRSNVGKSSFINAMLNRRNLAKSSATPGKTRVINFYNIDETCYFVDLPGYGYAKVSKAEKATWDRMIKNYLEARPHLKLIIMLVDVRHAPSPEDQMMFDWLLTNQENPVLILASKLDKIPRSQIQKHLKRIRQVLEMNPQEMLIPFSATNRQGTKEVWEVIRQIIKNWWKAINHRL